MSYMWPDDDGFGESRGWDRASIAMNTRHEYRPDVRQQDFLFPNKPGNARTFLLCSIAGVCMALLYVGLPLFIVTIFVPSLGPWLGISFAAAFFGLPAALFVFSKHEDKRLHRLAREL